MSIPLARRKSSSSLSNRTPGNSFDVSSEQANKKAERIRYQDPRYATILATKGVYMTGFTLGITATSKSLCRKLLESQQNFPVDSLFCDSLFEKTCQMVLDRKEARVVRDIAPLLVPSAELLALRGAKHLDILIEGVSEGWDNSVPIISSPPQPDFSVAFRQTAFSDEQLQKISRWTGDVFSESFFKGSFMQYFPFLASEAKRGNIPLDVADRQTAHSMAMAVRGIVALFRLVKREEELDREILAFSITHDDKSVRIWGHYPVIKGEATSFYRHRIRSFDFADSEGREKWTAYQFTKNVYDLWMPDHFRRICSVIDAISPELEVNEDS